MHLGRHAAPLAVGDPAPRRILAVAAKFGLDKREIRVRKGEAVTLQPASPDLVHGYASRDLDARIDLVPERAVKLVLKPQRAGPFVFLCDNFCGEGHDRMTGFLIVAE